VNLEETIRFFINDHQKLEEVLSKLTSDQLSDVQVQGNWTVKDILAHISAWNWELIKQTNLVISGKKPWYKDTSEAEFNEKSVKTRESWSLDKVLSEWRESFDALLARLNELSQEEWTFELDEDWPEGGKITVASIFEYQYHGEGHEGGHAKVIQEYLNLS
jgi:hypothetical protein